MDIFKLAKELNKEILNSREYIELKEVEKHVLKDERSTNLLQEYLKYKNMLLRIEELKESNNIERKMNLRVKLTRLYEDIESDPKLFILINKLNNYITLRKELSRIIDSNIEFSKSLYLLEDEAKKCDKGCKGCNKTRG